MKTSLLTSLLTLLAHYTSAQCNFCPSGITSGKESTVVPNTDGLTCQSLAAIALSGTDDSLECAQIKTGAHPLCCPQDIGSGCNFCPTGVEIEELIVDPTDNSTCADYGYISQVGFPAFCDIIEIQDSICCPNKTGTPCNDFCPGGVTNPDVTAEFGEGNSVRCADVAWYVAGLSSDLDDCQTIKFQRNACCPADVGPGCTFCPNGVTNPFLVVDAEGDITCTTLAGLAPIAPQDTCTGLTSAEAACCPGRTNPPSAQTSPPSAPSSPPSSATRNLIGKRALISAIVGLLFI